MVDVYVSCHSVLFLMLIISSCFAKAIHMSRFAAVPNSQAIPFGTEITGAAIDISLQECVDQCRNRPACHLINYRLSANFCLFVRNANTGIPLQIIPKKGYAFSAKSEMGSCEGCQLTERCSGSGPDATCVTTSCGAPLVPENAELYGNIYTIGSRLILRCHDGTLPQQEAKKQITCLPSGMWTDTSFACLNDTTTTAMATTTTTATTTTATTAATTTTTQSTTSAPPFICHPADNTYRTVTLQSGTSLTYKLVQAAVTKDDASAVCQGDGGELIKIVDLNRLNFVMNRMNCSGMFSHDIWIDGTWSGTGSLYITTDGDVVPLDADFWAPGTPNQVDIQHCIRLIPYNNYLMDNQSCSRLYSYMCEIP